MPYFKALGLFNACFVEAKKPHVKWADGAICGSVCIVLYAKFLVCTKVIKFA